MIFALLLPTLLLGVPPIATVNGDAITGPDVIAEFTRRHGGHARFLGGEVEVRRFLDVVIDQRLLVQEAYRLELDRQPEIATAAEEYRVRKAVERLLKREVEDRVKPTEAEVRAAWETRTTTLYEVLQVVTATREEAEAARARVAAGESMEAVAREVSVAPSRLMGGRLHSVGWGGMDAAWEDIAFALPDGELSPVFETEQGFELVKMESRRTAEKPAFDKARPRIVAVLERRARETRKRELSERLWAAHGARLVAAERSWAALDGLRTEAPDTVIASWTGGALTVKDFFAQLGRHEAASLSGPHGARAVEARIRAMVNEPLARLEAQARGDGTAPEVEADVRAYRERLMEGALLEGYVLKDLALTDEEVRADYEARRSELVLPEKRRIAHIVVASGAEAEEVKKRLAEGEPFEELVKARSTDKASVPHGGDLGWVTAKEVPPEFAAVLALPEGEVSAPITSKHGVHLMKVTAVEPVRPLTFDEARDEVRKLLLQKAQRERRKAWVDKLRAAARVRVDGKAVRAFARQQERQDPVPAAMNQGHQAR